MSLVQGARMSLVAGIDLGGTYTRIGLVDERGGLIARTKVMTGADDGPETVLARVATVVGQLAKDAAPGGPPAGAAAAAGLALPGPLDLRRGLLLTTPNLPWRDVPVRNLLAASLGLPVHLERDANAALRGEAWLGAARDQPDAVLLTLGTGIGGAALVRGEILHGRDGMAGEFGHITLVPDGPLCGCGNRGCLEALASGTALRARTGREPAEVFAAAERGEAWARDAVNGMATALGAGLAALANSFNPARIVIGGGLLAQRRHFWPEMLRELERRAFPAITAELAVVPAQLGEWAGVLGAAAVALEGESHGTGT